MHLQDLLRNPFRRVHCDGGTRLISELASQPLIIGKQAEEPGQGIDVTRGEEKPGLALDEDFGRPASPSRHDRQPGSHSLEHDLPKGLWNDRCMNEYVDSSKFCDNVTAKSTELDAFRDA